MPRFQTRSTCHSCRDEYFSRTSDTTRATSPSKSSKSSCGGNTGFAPSPPPSISKPTSSVKSQNVRRRAVFLVAHFNLVYTACSKSRSPRCRFHATFEGFEWFLYNRTAAFDNIVAQMDAKTPVPERRAQSPAPDGATSHIRHIFSKSSPGGDSAYMTPLS